MNIKNTAYLKDYSTFFNHRYDYYTRHSDIKVQDLKNKIYTKQLEINLFHRQRFNAVNSIANSSARVIITTASKNRKQKIINAYTKLLQQKFTNWHWIIVDNGSSDFTMEEVESWNDKRVSIIDYIELTGCAYPVRNFAFDMLQMGLRNNYKHSRQVVLNIDSDDELYDEYSLSELVNLDNKASLQKGGFTMIHGFAVWETYDEHFKPIISSCPAEIDNSFPEVSRMQDIFDKGLIFLAAAVPARLFSWLRYPQEFSFEDDAINQKLMLFGLSKHLKWLYTDYPIILKGYSGDTMINQNNQVGDLNMTEVIGINHRVTGVRAQIVSNLRKLRDFYIRNNL